MEKKLVFWERDVSLRWIYDALCALFERGFKLFDKSAVDAQKQCH